MDKAPMEFIKVSAKGDMAQVKDESGSHWFFLSIPVSKFIGKLQEGDKVEVSTVDEDDKSTIVFLKKLGGYTGGGSKPSYGGGYKNSSGGYKKTETKSYGRSPEELDSIKKQAMMKSAADAVATAMQGQVDIDSLWQQIKILYTNMLSEIS